MVLMLFFAAWFVVLVSGFLILVEMAGMWRFWPSVFDAGIRVLHETRPLPLPTDSAGTKFETNTGEFKVIDPHLLFFRMRFRLFGLDLHTPFPIKGSLRWNNEQATVEGRIPVSSTLFVAAWFVGFTLTVIQAGGGPAASLIFASAVGVCLFSIPFEIRHARRILNEYEDSIATRLNGHFLADGVDSGNHQHFRK